MGPEYAASFHVDQAGRAFFDSIVPGALETTTATTMALEEYLQTT